MTWWAPLAGGIALLLILLMLSIPIFVSFLILNLAGVLMLFGTSGFGLFEDSTTTTSAKSQSESAALAACSSAMQCLMALSSATARAVSTTTMRAMFALTRELAACSGSATASASALRPVSRSHFTRVTCASSV